MTQPLERPRPAIQHTDDVPEWLTYRAALDHMIPAVVRRLALPPGYLVEKLHDVTAESPWDTADLQWLLAVALWEIARTRPPF